MQKLQRLFYLLHYLLEGRSILDLLLMLGRLDRLECLLHRVLLHLNSWHCWRSSLLAENVWLLGWYIWRVFVELGSRLGTPLRLGLLDLRLFKCKMLHRLLVLLPEGLNWILNVLFNWRGGLLENVVLLYLVSKSILLRLSKLFDCILSWKLVLK